MPVSPARLPRLRARSHRIGALARAAAFVSLAAVAMLAAHAVRAGQPPQLGGFWQLDLQESETLQQKLEALRGSGGGPGGPGGGWHGGMGGMPPMGGTGGHHGGYGGAHPEGGGHGAGRDTTRRAALRELAHPPLSLRIEPGDDAFVLSERGRPIEVLVLGDAATAGASIMPEAPHLQAQWKGKHLVAEAVSSRGGRMTQDLELTEGGRKLIVRTKLEGREGRAPLELKRVYNRAESEEAAPSDTAP